MQRFSVRSPLVVFVALLWAASPVAAQNYSELRGRVVDGSGAVLPGVTIVIRNQDTGQFREVVSNTDGSYLATGVLPGVYEVSAELSGFKRFVRRDVRLTVGQVTTIPIQLEVGRVEETVTVTGVSPIVDITSKQIGGNLDSRELIDTPVANRNFTGYMQLLPGVVAAELTSWGADSVSINGQPYENTNYALDGGFNNDMWNGGAGGAQVRTPIESIAEFQVQTSQYDAEVGGATGGVLNAVSKQGTNQFHGSAFGFFQDHSLTRTEFFSRELGLAKPDNNQKQWGGSLGGPIVRDKAHFFVNLERVTQDRPVTVNIASRPELEQNVVWKDRVWNALARFDQQISANHTWALRWLSEWSPQSDQLTSTARTFATREAEDDLDYTYSGSVNSVFGGTKVNIVRASITQEHVQFGNPRKFEAGNQAALQPTLDMLTFLDQQSARDSERIDRTYDIDDTFSWFIANKAGDHDVKFGVQYVYAPLHFRDNGNANGTFFFNTDLPFDAANPRTYPERLQIRVPGQIDYRLKGHFIGSFAQDKWKLNPRTTLSLGVRYDIEDLNVPEADNPLFGSGGKRPVDTNNIAPRVGLTLALDDQSRSVIRGGAGLFYQKTPYFPIGNFFSNSVFANSFTVLFPIAGVDPGPTRGQVPTDPFLVNGPTVNRDLLAQRFPPGTRVKNTGDVFLDNPDRHNEFAREYTVGYERQLFGDSSVTVDYVHAENRDQLVRMNLNPPTRVSTSRTASVVRPDANFVQNVWELINAGRYDYDSLQLQFVKRFSHGYSYRVSYSRARTDGNFGGGPNEIIGTQVGNDLRLDANQGPTDDDRSHILSLSGTVAVPRAPGLTVGSVARYMSGNPFSLTTSQFDLNRNGRFDDEFLQPGSYTGTGRNPFAVDYEGGRNGTRGPSYFELDLRLGYSLPKAKVQLFGEIYNLTDHDNFNSPTNSGNASDQRLSSFLDLRTLRRGNTSRRGQIGIRYAF